MSTSKVLVDRYFRGRDILHNLPENRTDEELGFLKKWMPENLWFFRKLNSGDLRMILESVMLQTFFANEVIYEQDATVFNFYVILRGSLSLLVDSSNIQKALQTTSNTDTATMPSKEGRKFSVYKPATSKREGNACSKHPYGKEVFRIGSGDYFGERALLQRESRAQHTARTNEMTELLVIDVDTFNECLHSYFQEVALKRAEFLAKLEWFKNWTPHMLRQLTFMLQERHYRFEDCLYRQGMLVSGIHFIQSGSVRISTHRNTQPPEELLDKIQPQKDYLPEILAEDLPETSTSKVSVFSNTSDHMSIVESLSGVFPVKNPGSSATSFKSQALAQKRQRSATSAGKNKQKQEARRKGKTMMGFVIHQPNPETNIDLCILGPGDVLCDSEAICKLRKNLYNAVCESDVTVYELSKFYFELVLENWMPRVLHQMTCQAKQRAETWGAKHTSVCFFPPLIVVLEQTEERLVGEGSHKCGRKRPLYTPSMLAWTAVKGLGKTPQGAVVVTENGIPQAPLIMVHPSSESCSSQCPPSPNPKLVLPVSPFEPQMPDFERMYSLMRFSHPRFKSAYRKSIFDSPLPTGERCDSRVSASNSKTRCNSTPVPEPYHVIPAVQVPSPRLSIESETQAERKPEVSDDKIQNHKRFPTANDPDTLAKIRMGIQLGFGPTQNPPSATNLKDAKQRLDLKRSQSKLLRSKSTRRMSLLAPPPMQTPPTLQKRHVQALAGAEEEEEEEEEDGGSKSEKTETKVSFSLDNEVTAIPKEYTRLGGRPHGGRSVGVAGECGMCRQQYYHVRGSTYYTLPFMKTMMKVIENRTSSLLTKYRLSLAVNSNLHMAQRNNPKNVPQPSEHPHQHHHHQHQHQHHLHPGLLGCASGSKRLATHQHAMHFVKHAAFPRHLTTVKRRKVFSSNQWLQLT